MLFYSGDTDGSVNTYGSKRWIKSLGWPLKNDWRAWMVDKQVGGYIERYDGLDFVTVHGTGHMAPEWKPKEVEKMFSNWIHNEFF